MVTLI